MSGPPIRMDALKLLLKSYPYQNEVKARRKKRNPCFLVNSLPLPLSLRFGCMAQVPPYDP